MNSPKTRIDDNGVRSSWDTLETNSFFIADSFISRIAVRTVSAIPPRRTAASTADIVMLSAKLARAHFSGAANSPCRLRVQSVKMKSKWRLARSFFGLVSSPPGRIWCF